jgi:hypothetical protein
MWEPAAAAQSYEVLMAGLRAEAAVDTDRKPDSMAAAAAREKDQSSPLKFGLGRLRIEAPDHDRGNDSPRWTSSC